MVWNYVIDGILILVVLFCTIMGIVKGLFDSILSLFGTGIAIAVSIFTAKYVANFINKMFNFEQFLLDKIDEAVVDGASGTTATSGVTKNLIGSLPNSEIAKFGVWVLSIVIVFIVVKLTIFILSKIFESVVKNSPTISGLNRVFGMLFGLVRGAATAIAMIAVCSLLCNVPGIGTSIHEKITNTTITSKIYKFVDEYVDENLTEEKIKDIIDRITSEATSKEDANDKQSGSTESSSSASNGTTLALNNNTLILENVN